MSSRTDVPSGGDSKKSTGAPSTSGKYAQDRRQVKKVLSFDHLTNTRGLYDIRAPANPLQAQKVMEKLFRTMDK